MVYPGRTLAFISCLTLLGACGADPSPGGGSGSGNSRTASAEGTADGTADGTASNSGNSGTDSASTGVDGTADASATATDSATDGTDSASASASADASATATDTATGTTGGATMTSASASNTGGGGFCDPDVVDHPCVACAKAECCQLILACFMDGVCLCLADCAQMGTDLDTCDQLCGGSQASTELIDCAQANCVDCN